MAELVSLAMAALKGPPYTISPMCGINGVLSFADGAFRVTPSYVTCMRDAMRHRGPDGAGCWIDDARRVGLGHRRLSIIDLSAAGSQPMSNEDGSLWLTYNGEIYNHRELREELERTGRHLWKSHHCDTEVILHAFEEWGIDCLSRFRGMFAFGLWDARARQLWLVRDRIGIKPLYYSVHHGRLTFASAQRRPRRNLLPSVADRLLDQSQKASPAAGPRSNTPLGRHGLDSRCRRYGECRDVHGGWR